MSVSRLFEEPSRRFNEFLRVRRKLMKAEARCPSGRPVHILMRDDLRRPRRPKAPRLKLREALRRADKVAQETKGREIGEVSEAEVNR